MTNSDSAANLRRRLAGIREMINGEQRWLALRTFATEIGVPTEGANARETETGVVIDSRGALIEDRLIALIEREISRRE